MAKIQKYGILYPFKSENQDMVFLDLNESYNDKIKSMVMHIVLTPKGTRIRMPEFGSNLTDFLFEQSDTTTYSDVKQSIMECINKYIPEITFEDITINDSETSDNEKVIIVTYSVMNGNKKEITKVGINI